jgi:hypothetical protein
LVLVQKLHAKIPNKVARVVFVEQLLKRLQGKLDSTEQMQLSTAVKLFLENFDAAPLIQLHLNSSLLPQEDNCDIVHSMESIFKTSFQVLILAGLPKHERNRLMNEFCFDRSNIFLGQADTVVIPNTDQPILLLVEFKNSRVSDLVNMPSIWQQQVEKSREFLNYNEDQLLDLQLKISSYNRFKNIRGRFDDTCQELQNNACKIKNNFPGKKIVGFVIYRVGLHRVVFKRFDNL